LHATAASSYTSTSPSQIFASSWSGPSPQNKAKRTGRLGIGSPARYPWRCIHELAGTIDCLAHTSLKASMICWLKERMWMMQALSLVN